MKILRFQCFMQAACFSLPSALTSCVGSRFEDLRQEAFRTSCLRSIPSIPILGQWTAIMCRQIVLEFAWFIYSSEFFWPIVLKPWQDGVLGSLIQLRLYSDLRFMDSICFVLNRFGQICMVNCNQGRRMIKPPIALVE